MIDSHCHLTDARLLNQLDDVLARARQAGVHGMITIGTSTDDARQAIQICNGRNQLRCAVGIHPNYCHEASVDDLRVLREIQSHSAVVALGETGLDYFHKFADRQTQHHFFEAQLKLAAELNRTVIIHCRQATDDTLAVMRQFPSVPAVFHCFTGTRQEADQILAAGYSLGFTGPVTFKRSDELREIVRHTPHDRLLVETDSPYLTPEPVRKQKINEPAMVMHVAAEVARQWQVDLDTVRTVTTANVARLFGWELT